eukprot:756140-Hanusia_phi.AAC.4
MPGHVEFDSKRCESLSNWSRTNTEIPLEYLVATTTYSCVFTFTVTTDVGDFRPPMEEDLGEGGVVSLGGEEEGGRGEGEHEVNRTGSGCVHVGCSPVCCGGECEQVKVSEGGMVDPEGSRGGEGLVQGDIVRVAVELVQPRFRARALSFGVVPRHHQVRHVHVLDRSHSSGPNIGIHSPCGRLIEDGEQRIGRWLEGVQHDRAEVVGDREVRGATGADESHLPRSLRADSVRHRSSQAVGARVDHNTLEPVDQ